MSKACPTCNSEFGKVSGICPTCNFDYAGAKSVFGRSDTTITSCQSCGQEMHPIDYAQRLRDQLAAYQAAMPEAEYKITLVGDNIDWQDDHSLIVNRPCYGAEKYLIKERDALAKRCARQAVELEAARNYWPRFAIRLASPGHVLPRRTTVDIEVDGQWRVLIEEASDIFCHIIEPLGIEAVLTKPIKDAVNVALSAGKEKAEKCGHSHSRL